MYKNKFLVIGVGFLLLFMLASCLSKEADKSDPDNQDVVNSDSTDVTDTLEVEKVIVGTIKNVKGDVLVVDENDSGIDAADGMEIAQGWSIKTGNDSSASIEFSPEMEAFIGNSAHISVEETTGDDEILLTQHAGLIYHAGHHDNYLVQTDSAEVIPVGTHFTVWVDPRTSDIMMTVFSGIVSARSNQSSAQSDEDDDPFNLYPSQSMGYSQNDDYWERFFEGIEFMEEVDQSIIEALIINTNEIAAENEALLRSIRDQLNRGDSPEGLDPEMDLEELRNRLDRLIGDIVSSAIQSNIVSEEDVERIIREANARRDENDRIDIGRIFSDEARREQLREEQQRRAQQQREEREQRQRELQDRTQDRQAQLLAEQQRAERERQAQLRQRQDAAANEAAAREALKKRLEEEKKKQEREQKEKEEQERKRLAEEKAKQVAPAHGPLNVTFIDESPLAGKVSGDIVVGKASDESKIDSYILYWVNSQKEKVGKIAALGKTGKDMKYKLKETEIPKNTAGILALASNRYGESVQSAYTKLDDLQGMSVKNPIEDIEILWGEDKFLDVSDVFVDKDGSAIVHGSSNYTWKVTSSDEGVVLVSLDEKLHFYDIQPGNSIMTISLTDNRTNESISESFKVTVKSVTVSGTVTFNGPIDDEDLMFGIVGYNHEDDNTLGLYTKELSLNKSELNFELELPFNANRIKYGFTYSRDSARLISNILEFGDEMEIDLVLEKDKKINLEYNVIERTYDEEICHPHDCFNYEFIFGDDYERAINLDKFCTLNYNDDGNESFQCSNGEFAIDVVERLINYIPNHSNVSSKSYIFYQSDNNATNGGNVIVLNYIHSPSPK